MTELRDEPDMASRIKSESYSHLPRHANLTPREIEIAVAIARGMTYREVADHLSISYHTVNAHMKTILSKTGFSNSRKLAVAVADAIRREEITVVRDGKKRGNR